MPEGRFRRLAVTIAILGALHGLLYVPLISSNTGTDTRTYTKSATALLHGSYTTPLWAGFYFTYPNGFYDLTGVHTAPAFSPVFFAPERQAFRPPGYPLLLAAVGGGDGGVSELAALVAQAALFGGGALFLMLAMRRWWSPRIALAAGAVYAADPYSKHYVALVLSETLAGFLLLAGVYAYTRAHEERSTGWWTAAGALAAALTLTRAVFAVVLPLVLLGALVRSGNRVRNGGAALASAALLLVPWLAWTDHVTGKPVLANWGEGFNLLLAAHGERLGHQAAEIERDPSFLHDFASARRSAPTRAVLLRDPYAHPRYLRRADAELASRARAIYRRRIADEPAQVVWENLYRNYFLWTAHHDWYQPRGAALVLLQALDWILLALAAAGGALAVARGGPARGVVLFLLAYSVTLSTHHVEARFAMPLRGLFLALAVYAVGDAVSRRRAATRRAGGTARNSAQIQNGTVGGLPTDVR